MHYSYPVKHECPILTTSPGFIGLKTYFQEVIVDISTSTLNISPVNGRDINPIGNFKTPCMTKYIRVYQNYKRLKRGEYRVSQRSYP